MGGFKDRVDVLPSFPYVIPGLTFNAPCPNQCIKPQRLYFSAPPRPHTSPTTNEDASRPPGGCKCAWRPRTALTAPWTTCTARYTGRCFPVTRSSGGQRPAAAAAAWAQCPARPVHPTQLPQRQLPLQPALSVIRCGSRSQQRASQAAMAIGLFILK